MFQTNYVKFYDQFNHDKPYEKEIQFIYKWANEPKTIFDIGCGTAIYWKYYPKETLIIGIDQSKSFENRKDMVLIGDIADFKPRQRNFECATAFFDVLNYIPSHHWWKNIPIKKGTYFIFDIWDKRKVDAEGFRETTKRNGSIVRRIIPLDYDGKISTLRIDILTKLERFQEDHTMYIHSHQDIEKFCDKEFKIEEIKNTNTWQIFYKLRRL